MSIHLTKLPSTPIDAATPSPLPLWHKEVAVLDPVWADEAAGVLDLLSRSDYGMVQSNAIGGQGEGSAAAYSKLLLDMQSLQEDTVKDQNKKTSNWLVSTWDAVKKTYSFRDNGSLVERMEELLRARKELIDNARNRMHGLQSALDQRAEVDDRAMDLLAKIPELQSKAEVSLEEATLVLAQTPEGAEFEVFRRNQLLHRSAEKVPHALTLVREQLQNAVILGAPLRDTLDQFISIEETNQSQFELSFSVHVSNLAVLQGMQQSKRNASATQDVIKALPLPQFLALPAPDKVEKEKKKGLGPTAGYSKEFMMALTALEEYQEQSIKTGNFNKEEMSPHLIHKAQGISSMFSQLVQHEKEKLLTGISVKDPMFPLLMQHANLPFQKNQSEKPFLLTEKSRLAAEALVNYKFTKTLSSASKQDLETAAKTLNSFLDALTLPEKEQVFKAVAEKQLLQVASPTPAKRRPRI